MGIENASLLYHMGTASATPWVCTSPGGNREQAINDFREYQDLPREIAEHLKADTKADKRWAIVKLDRIAAVASTLSFTKPAVECAIPAELKVRTGSASSGFGPLLPCTRTAASQLTPTGHSAGVPHQCCTDRLAAHHTVCTATFNLRGDTQPACPVCHRNPTTWLQQRHVQLTGNSC